VAGSPEWTDFVTKELEKRVETLTARGAKLMLTTFPYTRPWMWSTLSNGDELEQDTRRREAALNDIYRDFAAQHLDSVVLVDLNSFADPDGKYSDLYIDGVRMREDGVHFTPAGSAIVAGWLGPQIVAAAGKPAQ
jgi:hypothetical protein